MNSEKDQFFGSSCTEPNCVTCWRSFTNKSDLYLQCNFADKCISGSMYNPLPIVALWNKDSGRIVTKHQSPDITYCETP